MSDRYFFGYFYFGGRPLALAAVEQEGKPIGGKVDFIDGNRHEITFEEFRSTLDSLCAKYPFKEPTPSSG